MATLKEAKGILGKDVSGEFHIHGMETAPLCEELQSILSVELTTTTNCITTWQDAKLNMFMV